MVDLARWVPLTFYERNEQESWHRAVSHQNLPPIYPRSPLYLATIVLYDAKLSNKRQDASYQALATLSHSLYFEANHSSNLLIAISLHVKDSACESLSSGTNSHRYNDRNRAAAELGK